jgi:hypothetical protein
LLNRRYLWLNHIYIFVHSIHTQKNISIFTAENKSFISQDHVATFFLQPTRWLV